MSPHQAYYTLLFIFLTLLLIPYLQAAFPNSTWWIPSELSFRAPQTALSKAFLILIIGTFTLAVASLFDMTNKVVNVSILNDDAAHEKLYIDMRDSFLKNPIAMKELERWRARDNKYEYSILKTALIPQSVVGKNIGGASYAESDTWLSEYKSHFADLILSESTDSYIIVNKESYDTRQYPIWVNDKYIPGENTPEGQAFAHILVIPKKRIFNIVDPDATANGGELLKAMRDHFVSFWTKVDGLKKDRGPEKILKRVKVVIQERNDILGWKQQDLDLYNTLVGEVRSTYEEMSKKYATLKVKDFMFAFHPFPQCSVGHLHMHVFPKDDTFRKYSTTRHDKKTIPLDVILKVEGGN